MLITLTFGIVIASYSFHIEPAWIEVVQLQETLPRLSPAFQSFKIVQISDTHVGRLMGQERLNQIIDLVNEQEPDLVTITGDFVTHHPDRYADTLISGLRRLTSKHKTVGVLGNHDYSSDPVEVRRILQEGGVLELSNSVYTIQRGEEQLQVAGLDDLWAGKTDLDEVLEQLPQQGAAILLIHEPDFADTSSLAGRFDLELSGHSHGGQIRFPFVGGVWFPRDGRIYTQGRYQVGDMVHYTNRGVGMMAIGARLLCRPEITVFTLQAPA
ncbi:MAG: metallophosphoesterase [Cyanophyceae cyanobacterium]